MMDDVKIRRMGNGYWATVIGTISGFVTGGLIGYFVTSHDAGSYNPGGLCCSPRGAQD
jgi:hypothetical protein